MNLLQEKDLKYIWHPCSQMKDYEELPPIIIKNGQGVYLYDMEGKEYLDVISSWWCNLFGHCNPKINQAIKKQIDRLEHVIFANFSHEPAIDLCEALHEILPKELDKFHFSDNGSAAVECALKMSFQYHYQTGHPQKKRFLSLTDAYHGETTGALSIGGLGEFSKIYQPLLFDIIRVQAPNCYRCAYGEERDTCQVPCFEHVLQALDIHADECAAFIVEPLVQGAAGMRIYPKEYLTQLSAACKKRNVHLIVDEIATGFGRTGKMFASNHANISPDIMCISKGLTGGYLPMAITITSQKIYDAFYDDYKNKKAFMHSHTYSGNPLACAAALAVLEIFKEENILEKVQKKGIYFHQKLLESFGDHPHIGEVRHIGLINALELVLDKKTKKAFDSSQRVGYQIYKKALTKGLLLRPLGDILYFNPPLSITYEEMEKAIILGKSAIDEFFQAP